jgi:hypothetical protein
MGDQLSAIRYEVDSDLLISDFGIYLVLVICHLVLYLTVSRSARHGAAAQRRLHYPCFGKFTVFSLYSFGFRPEHSGFWPRI